jgi:hypothetical protein
MRKRLAALALAALVAVSMLAGGCAACGNKANQASCLRSLERCTNELAARGCADPATGGLAPVPTDAGPGPGPGAGGGMNAASCLASTQACHQRLAACPAPVTPPR